MARFALLDENSVVVQVQDDRGIVWIAAVLRRLEKAGRAVELAESQAEPLGQRWNGRRFFPG